MDSHDLIVVGGGVSGLTFACRGSAHGWRTLLLEGDSRVGGCLATHRFDGAAAGFWTEMAAHTAYNSYGALLELLGPAALARLQARHKRPWRAWDGRRLQSVFARLHWPSLLAALPRLFSTNKAGYGLRGYYSRVFGSKTYEGLLRHAFGAVLAQPADDFPAELLFRKKPRRKDVPRSYTLAGGLLGLAETLASACECHTGMKVGRIEREGQGFRVHAEGQSWACRRLALAVPAWEAARLLAEAYPDLARQLARIAPAEVESMAVAVAKEGVVLPEIAGLIGIDQAFYSAVSRDVVPDARLRGFTFHFRPGRLSREEKLECIGRVLGIETSAPLAIAERTSRLPALKAGHADWLAKIDRALAGQPLALSGNYFQGVSLGDCAERSRDEFARLARSG
ncbi:MAG: FAD-dependent oxidoreductase [Betaproteobacteria bacterium]|nr:FAD-dependent oxidoreductase [Betaproteobacteria bacterium]